MKRLFEPGDDPMRVAIFLSGSGTNAVKILKRYLEQMKSSGHCAYDPVLLFSDNPDSNIRNIFSDFKDQKRSLGKAADYELHLCTKDIRKFHDENGLDIKDIGIPREKYDHVQADVLRSRSIDLVVLAGYDWVVSTVIYQDFRTINVHPGNLRVKDDSGKPLYHGLGWVPSAKAMLNGEKNVYSSVHIVNGELDGGQLLAISKPVKVPDEVIKITLSGNSYSVPSYTRRRMTLLGKMNSKKHPLSEISEYVRDNPEIARDDDKMMKIAPVFVYASRLQNQLKINGDWIILPQVVDWIAQGHYLWDDNNNLCFNTTTFAIPDGVEFKK